MLLHNKKQSREKQQLAWCQNARVENMLLYISGSAALSCGAPLRCHTAEENVLSCLMHECVIMPLAMHYGVCTRVKGLYKHWRWVSMQQGTVPLSAFGVEGSGWNSLLEAVPLLQVWCWNCTTQFHRDGENTNTGQLHCRWTLYCTSWVAIK